MGDALRAGRPLKRGKKMKRKLAGAVCLLVLLSAFAGGEEKDVTYLMSVSFSVPSLDKWTEETVKQFHATPYDGIAANVGGSHVFGPLPKIEDFSRAAELIASSAKGEQRHVWPWIFLNRIIAPDPERGHRAWPKKRAGARFRGIDLDGSAGALKNFYGIWRMSLRLAKQLGSPGIVLDPEAYSDYSVASIRYLSKASGKSPDEVTALLRGIGARLADITKEEFPDAIIWTLFTRFESDPDLSTMTPILFDGLLMRAKEKNIPLTLVDGGETVGYAFINLQNLRRHHDLRALQVSRYVEKYGGHLVMGCTIAPWADARERSTWMTEWPSCVNSVFKTVGDFEPVFVELMRRYRYFWIYAASAAPYDPLKPKSAGRYNPIIAKALAEARRLGPLPPPKLPKLSDLKAAKALTKNLAGDTRLWSVRGGPEASMAALPAEEGGPGIRFVVDVNTKQRGNEKYPAGWLFLNRDLGDAGSVGAAVGIRLRMRFHQESKIRIGLREKSGAKTQWVSIRPDKVGQWQDVALPVELFALEDREGVRRVSFYVAEGWYLHGDHLVFDIKEMVFCKK